MALPDLYGSLDSSNLDYVAVAPATWTTEAPWRVESLSGVLPALSGVHRYPTNPDTIAQVTGLIVGIGLPAIVAELAPQLALPGVYPTPGIEHVEWASVVGKASGARKSAPAEFPCLEFLVVLPSLVAGVPTLRQIVQVPGAAAGAEAMSAVQSLIAGYVVPAIKAEVGL